MEAFLKTILAMPLANLLIVAGIIFLFVSVAGDISGKIAPGKSGRIASAVIGAVLLVTGLGIYFTTQEKIKSSEVDSERSSKQNQAGNTPGSQGVETFGSASSMSELEYGTNRYGGDYRSFEASNPSECRNTCAHEPQCVAFTFVKAGFQGPIAICWLKQTVPNPSPGDCCVSGVKQ